MMNKVYVHIALLLDARARCEERGNREWFSRHTERINALAREYLPSGSGWDSGTSVDLDASTADKIVLNTAFHHMDGETGMYSHWSQYRITIKPSLAFGFVLRIARTDKPEKVYRNFRYVTIRPAKDPFDFRDFAYQELELCLSAEIDPDPLFVRLDGAAPEPQFSDE
jgi:hypothetical protein